jgi:hypothetical protein
MAEIASWHKCRGKVKGGIKAYEKVLSHIIDIVSWL